MNHSILLFYIESLDELEAMAVEYFSPVKCIDGVIPPTWPESPYGPDEIKKQLFVVPIKDLRSLVITFPIPDLSEYYKACVSIIQKCISIIALCYFKFFFFLSKKKL